MASKLRLVRGGGASALDRPPASGSDDLAALVQASRGGDERAIRTLLTALGSPMLQVIRKVLGARHPDVEDALQEATVSLMRALPGFRGECSTRTFARRIAACAAVDVRRRSRRAPRPSEAPASDIDADAWPAPAAPVEAVDDLPGDPGGADWGLVARRRDLVRRLLDELPAPQAEALVLHCAVGMTLDELARASGVPLETARSRLRLAKAALRSAAAHDPAAIDLLQEELS